MAGDIRHDQGHYPVGVPFNHPGDAMKRYLLLLTLCLIGIGSTRAQTSSELMRSALLKERAGGDLPGAIGIYERIVRDHAADREIAAQALVQLGKAYETMGSRKAQEAYQRVVRDYADQSAPASEARSRLAALRTPATSSASRHLVVRKVLDGDDMGRPSPDGRYLSYVNWTYGNLAVYDFQTGERRDVTTEGTWDGEWQFSDVSLWAPDSRRIAYVWYRGEGADLRVLDIETGVSTVLVQGTAEGTPWPTDWSPDGRYIVAVNEIMTGDDGHHSDRIVLVDASTGDVRSLKDLPEGIHTVQMSISADSRFVVYETREKRDGPHDLHILAVDGSLDARLIEHPADDFAPRWIPATDKLLFTSNRSGQLGLWIQDVRNGRAQGEPRMITEGIGRGYSPLGFTARGDFYFHKIRPESNIYLAELDAASARLGKARRVFSAVDGTNFTPLWSPDGRTLAFLSRRGQEGETMLVFHDAASGTNREVPPQLAAQYGRQESPRWTADGASILLETRGDVCHCLRRINVQTGEVEAEIKGVYRRVASAPNGLFAVKGDDRHPEGRGIVYYDWTTGKESVVARPGGSMFHLTASRDGEHLAFIRSPNQSDEYLEQELIVMNPKIGESRTLWTGSEAESFSQDVSMDWLPDNRTLLLGRFKRPERTYQLYLVDSVTGERRALGPLMTEQDHVRHVRVSPDGTQIAFSKGDVAGEIWTIGNVLQPE